MSGDRWVVRYPDGQWGVEQATRHAAWWTFPTLAEALGWARAQAEDAGGGEVVVQGPDGTLTMHERIEVAEHPRVPRPRPAVPRDRFVRTLL